MQNVASVELATAVAESLGLDPDMTVSIELIFGPGQLPLLKAVQLIPVDNGIALQSVLQHYELHPKGED